MESHWRSVVKAMSWRIIALVVTAVIVWVLSGEVSLAIQAGVADSLIKIALYWAHERGWQRVQWGRYYPPTSSP